MMPLWWIRDAARDTSISSDGRALLLFIATQPASWRYSVAECIGVMRWGRQKFQGVMRELKAAGYVSSTHKRDRYGRVTFTKLTLTRSPHRRADFQPSAKPHRGDDLKASGPEGGKSAQTSLIDTTEKNLAREGVIDFSAHRFNARAAS